MTGWISLQSKGLSRVFSSTTVQKHQFFSTEPSLWPNSCICTWLLEKPQLWLYGPLSAKWCLYLLICCLGLSKLLFKGHLLISWIQSPSSVILEPKKIKHATVSIFSHLYSIKWPMLLHALFIFLIYFYLFLTVPGLHCCVQSSSYCSGHGLLSSWAVWAFHRSGFYCGGARALGHMGSVVVAPRL